MLAAIGIREVHRTSTERAALTVAGPAVVAILLSIMIAVTVAVLDASLSSISQSRGDDRGGNSSSEPGQSQGSESGGEQQDQGAGSVQPSSKPSGIARTYAMDIPDPSTSASPGLVVQNVGFNRADYGTLTFRGEILNKADEDAVAPRATVKLYNDQDEIVGKLETSSSLPVIIEPGRKAVWEALLSEDEAPEDWSRTEIEVVQDSAVADNYQRTDYSDLETSEVRLNPGDEYSSPTITAEVANTGEQKPELVQAYAGLYDADGKLVEVISMSGTGSASAPTPGESVTFEGYVDNPKVDPEQEYDIAVYLSGTRYP